MSYANQTRRVPRNENDIVTRLEDRSEWANEADAKLLLDAARVITKLRFQIVRDGTLNSRIRCANDDLIKAISRHEPDFWNEWMRASRHDIYEALQNGEALQVIIEGEEPWQVPTTPVPEDFRREAAASIQRSKDYWEARSA